MSELSPKTVAVLERVRHEFGPSATARHRMRARVLERVAETTAAPAADEGSRAPESGIRLALRANAGKLFAGLLVVLAGSAFAVMQGGSPAQAVRTPHEEVATPHDEVATPQEERPIAIMAAATPATPEPTKHIELASISVHSLPDAPAERAQPIPVLRARPIADRSPPPTVLPAAEPEPPARTKSPDSLDAEMRLVREAQAALKKGDLESARRALDAHALAYEKGVLREERLVLGVLLLCAEGRTGRARRTAAELAQASPRSSHLEPLRTSCAGPAVP